MTDLRDAAQQALKSLRGYRREIGCEQLCDAERALEAALEQTERAQAMRDAGYTRRPTLREMAEDEQPYAAQARRVEQETHGRMRIDPVTGDVSIGTPAEQPEQEPVEPLKGWKLNHARKHPDEEGVAEIGYLDPEDDRFAPILTVDTGLYYQDAQALPLAVAILSMLSAHPPRREWRGLDRDETMHLMNDTAENYWADEAHIQRFARAVEVALKERNHE